MELLDQHFSFTDKEAPAGFPVCVGVSEANLYLSNKAFAWFQEDMMKLFELGTNWNGHLFSIHFIEMLHRRRAAANCRGTSF